jgi:hypothetical protein
MDGDIALTKVVPLAQDQFERHADRLRFNLHYADLE